jgi:hypothetical protein
MARQYHYGRHGYGHHGYGHHGYGHHGYGHGGLRRWHWLHPHQYEPSGADADDDGNDTPPPPPPFPFPPPPPIFPGMNEMETERYGQHGRRRHRDDQEVSLNDEPAEPPGKETNGFRHSGRWFLREGKVILTGV